MNRRRAVRRRSIAIRRDPVAINPSHGRRPPARCQRPARRLQTCLMRALGLAGNPPHHCVPRRFVRCTGIVARPRSNPRNRQRTKINGGTLARRSRLRGRRHNAAQGGSDIVLGLEWPARPHVDDRIASQPKLGKNAWQRFRRLILISWNSKMPPLCASTRCSVVWMRRSVDWMKLSSLITSTVKVAMLRPWR